MGEYESALKAFDMALSAEISVDARKVALNNKGLALLRSGHAREAIPCFEKALDLDPNLHEVQNNLQQARETDARSEKGIVPGDSHSLPYC